MYTYADSATKLKVFTSLMQELEKTITPENVAVHPFLDHINSHLQNAILASRAAKESTLTPTLPDISSIAPGKNLDHQWRFKRTTSASGPKKKGIILK